MKFILVFLVLFGIFGLNFGYKVENCRNVDVDPDPTGKLYEYFKNDCVLDIDKYSFANCTALSKPEKGAKNLNEYFLDVLGCNYVHIHENSTLRMTYSSGDSEKYGLVISDEEMEVKNHLWFSKKGQEQLDIIVYHLRDPKQIAKQAKVDNLKPVIEFDTNCSSSAEEQGFFERKPARSNQSNIIFGFALNSAIIKGCKEKFEKIHDAFNIQGIDLTHSTYETFVLYNSLSKKIEKIMSSQNLNFPLKDHEKIYQIQRIRRNPTIIINREPKCEDLNAIDCWYKERGDKHCSFKQSVRPVWNYLYANVTGYSDNKLVRDNVSLSDIQKSYQLQATFSNYFGGTEKNYSVDLKEIYVPIYDFMIRSESLLAEIIINPEAAENSILRNITESHIIFDFHLTGEELEDNENSSGYVMDHKFMRTYKDICDEFYCILNITDQELGVTLIPHHNYELKVIGRLETAPNTKEYHFEQNKTFVSQAKPPVFAPTVSTHGYFIDEYEKKVTVYWELLPQWKFFSDPKRFSYMLEVFRDDTMILLEEAQSNEVFKKFPLEKFNFSKNSYEIKIYSKNFLGFSNFSRILIPQQSRNILPDLMINTFLGDNDRYNVSWRGQEVQNFGLVYCNSKTKGKSPTCSDFEVESVKNQSWKIVESPKTLRFGIVLESGIQWSDCMIDRNFHDCSDLATVRPQNFYTQKVGNATEYFSIYVYWEFDCQRCPLANYSIHYCIDNDDEMNVPCAPAERQSIENYNGKFKMENLEPYEKYKIQMMFNDRIVAESSDDTNRLAPKIPQNLSAEIGSNHLNLSFFMNMTTKDYKIEHKIYLESNENETVNFTQTSVKNFNEFQLGNLSCYKRYEIYVVSCGFDCSESSEKIFATTKACEPGLIRDQVIQGNMLSWNDPEMKNGPIDYYIIYRNDSTEFKVFGNCSVADPDDFIFEIVAVNLPEEADELREEILNLMKQNTDELSCKEMNNLMDRLKDLDVKSMIGDRVTFPPITKIKYYIFLIIGIIFALISLCIYSFKYVYDHLNIVPVTPSYLLPKDRHESNKNKKLKKLRTLFEGVPIVGDFLCGSHVN